MAPRLPKGKNATLNHNPTQAPPRAAVEGDNGREEAERVQLISFISRLTAADAAVELARAPFDAAKKARSQIVNYAKAAGFTAKELEKRMEEMKTGTREFAETAKREFKHRRWLGIIEPDQADLLTGTAAPAEAKDEAHWKGEGYKAGLRMMEAKPPKECPSRLVQAWMLEHERGFGESTAANAPKKTPPKPVADQAREDFKEDNPEVDVAKAAAKLKGDPKFMDRTAPPEAMEEVGELADGTKIVGEDFLPDDGFEASEEELAGQTTRKVVLESREETPEDVV